MSTELLEKMLANRDTQQSEIPVTTDSEQVVDNGVEVDAEATHEEPAPMNEGGNEEPERDQYAQPEPETEDQPEPEANAEQSENDKRFESLEKQRADQQSYYQHQINELKMKLEAKEQPAPEPEAKKLSDDELNDLFWDNPAEAIRLANQGQAQPQTNIQLQVQEGVQRSLHDDYDEVIAIVQRQASLNPQLEQEIMGSPDPAKAAYEKGTQFKKAQLISTDPVAYEKQLREKWEAEQSTTTKMPKRVGATNSSAPVRSNNKAASEGTSFQNMFAKKRR